jgi:hypothetical protein
MFKFLYQQLPKIDKATIFSEFYNYITDRRMFHNQTLVAGRYMSILSLTSGDAKFYEHNSELHLVNIEQHLIILYNNYMYNYNINKTTPIVNIIGKLIPVLEQLQEWFSSGLNFEKNNNKYILSYHLFKWKFKPSSVINRTTTAAAIHELRESLKDTSGRDITETAVKLNHIFIPFFVLMNGNDVHRHFIEEDNTHKFKTSLKLVCTQINWSVDNCPPEITPNIIRSSIFEYSETSNFTVTNPIIYKLPADHSKITTPEVIVISDFVKTLLPLTEPINISPSINFLLPLIEPVLINYIALTKMLLFEVPSTDQIKQRLFKNSLLKNYVFDYIKSKYGTSANNYESIDWDKILPQMLRDYLLSGLQGFMINDFNRHSLESNAMMTRRKLYDEFVAIFNDSSHAVMNMDPNTSRLFSLTKLMPFDANLEEKKFFIQQILEHLRDPINYKMRSYDGSCQIYKMTNYNVQRRIWLKLIWTIRHLGASYNIFNISATVSTPPLFKFSKDDIDSFDTDEAVKARLTAIKDYTIRRPYKNKATLSYSNVLLLAATTLNRKVESVKLTLDAAQIIARLTGEGCSTPGSGQSGGGYEDFNHLFKRSYYTYINGLKKRYKEINKKALK